MDEREAAWDELLAATPAGWYVGRPSLHDERGEWVMYAFDPAERPVMGRRKREWSAVGRTELDVVREMARCLREITAVKDRRIEPAIGSVDEHRELEPLACC